MLGSITPLGERGRRQRWTVTVAAFVAGSVAAGFVTGGVLGWVGSGLMPPSAIPSAPRWALLGVLLLAGIALDARAGGLRLPSSHRQVNEDWLSRYRGWIYGGAFGLQLGMGMVTIVTASTVYLTFVAAFLSGSTAAGAAIGATFGLVRSLPTLATAGIHRPAQLVGLQRRLRTWDRPTRRVAAVFQAALAACALLLAVPR
jgi:hypothetical protein